MAGAQQLTRIFSDVHYGDRASWATDLAQLQPLLTDASAIVCNGDMLDTRPGGPNPAHTAACSEAVKAFVRDAPIPITLITGNHDPSFSDQHWLELNGGEVLVFHGDVLFERIVPWGRDGQKIRKQIHAALAEHFAIHGRAPTFEERFALWRQVASSVAQRHQSERRAWKYIIKFAIDTIWPPTRVFRIFHSWYVEPLRAAEFARVHRPRAKYILLGHTHRPSIRPISNGPIVINTGCFCPPFGGYLVDLTPGRLTVRRNERHQGAFHPGKIVAEFPLTHP